MSIRKDLLTPICPLCQKPDECLRLELALIPTYWRCQNCDLIHLARKDWLSVAEETARYELHKNCASDAGYRNFLKPFLQKLLPHLPANRAARVLEFGCGESSVVTDVLRTQGHLVNEYDPMYRPDSSVLSSSYDFVTSTEVAEHLHTPLAVFTQLRDLLVAGGELWIMTGLHDGVADFANWHYRRDVTHVCFYSTLTFLWLAKTLSFTTCEVFDFKVVRLQTRDLEFGHNC